jgi:hypothetical protein
MITRHQMTNPLLTAALAMLTAIAIGLASCSSNQAQPPRMDLATTQISPANTGHCDIDAVKMCQATGGAPAQAAQEQATMPMPSYGPPNLPESVEFQIPAGQAIKLMCYYDPQHNSVYRADATPQSALTGNSVEYMKKQGFCTNK